MYLAIWIGVGLLAAVISKKFFWWGQVDVLLWFLGSIIVVMDVHISLLSDKIKEIEKKITKIILSMYEWWTFLNKKYSQENS